MARLTQTASKKLKANSFALDAVSTTSTLRGSPSSLMKRPEQQELILNLKVMLGCAATTLSSVSAVSGLRTSFFFPPPASTMGPDPPRAPTLSRHRAGTHRGC
jgi:hypothetical protein